MIGHSTPCRTPITQRPTHLARALMMAVPVMLAACGGGSGSDAPSTGIAVPAGFTVGYGTKGYTFQWSASVGASRYELFEDPDGPAGPQPEVIVGGANDHTITAFFHQIKSAQLHERVNATYRLRACDGTGCGAFTAAITPDVTQAIGYFKASNGEAIDAFGSAVALSADGRVMAVSATGERSNATCPTTSCDQADNSIANAGAVYVFSRNNSYGLWTLASYLKAGNNRAYDNGRYLDNGPRFGASLALSADGSTLVVGAPGETSSAKGVNGDASDTQTQGAGAAYVFKAIGSPLPHGLSIQWVQEAYIKASNTRPKADYSVDIMGYYVRDPQSFGSSVAVSSDGNLVAVGAPGEGSNATGINGDQSDNSAIRSGAVYTYIRSSSGAGGGSIWAHQAYLKASNTDSLRWKHFGESIALSGDGSTLAVGAPRESSSATGVNGNQQDQSASGSGAVYVFTQGSKGWSQQAYVKASNTAANDQFGLKLALSADGNTLAVGAQDESGSGTGINNPPGARTMARAGAAYLFTRSNDAWSQQAYLKASNTGQDHWYGSSLALSADGNTLAVGAMAEASSARGINGKQADNSAGGAGAAYVYQRSGGTWSQRAYLKASNTDAGDLFGASIALSGDGTTLAVGATGEDSLAKDIQGNQADNSGSPAYPAIPLPVSVGAVYLY